jgi:MATE family multidrug resistance protein
MGVACASLVGNSIGADKLRLAKSIGKLSVKSIFVIEIIIGSILLVGGRTFVNLFTNDAGVKRVGGKAIPFLAVFTMVDGIQGVSSGVLRGAGKQFVGAFANVIAFYGIGIPLAWVFCFKLNLGVNGLMLGIACGAIFQVVVLLVMVFFYEDYLYSAAINKHGFRPLREDEEIDEEEHLGGGNGDTTHGIMMKEMVKVNAVIRDE